MELVRYPVNGTPIPALAVKERARECAVDRTEVDGLDSRIGRAQEELSQVIHAMLEVVW